MDIIQESLPIKENVKPILERLNQCNCKICFSLANKWEKFEKFIKILNKRPSFQRKAEIRFLLENEKMTLENVEHCFNTKNGTCGCKIHRGRIPMVFCITPAIRDRGTFPNYWLSVYRKDDVYGFIKEWINNTQEISKEENNLIFIWDSTYFDCAIVSELWEMKDKYDHLVPKIENGLLSLNEIKNRFRLLSSDWALLRKNLSMKQLKLLPVDSEIDNLKELEEKIENLNLHFLGDHLNFDLPWL